MDVVPVVSKEELARFIRLPHQIYRDDSRWVAPLTSDERTRLTPGKNPFFEHAEAAYFLARSAGRDVGRIAASVDRNHDQFHGERQAAFGFLEAESADAVSVLLGEAARWGQERGARVLRGPLNFTTNDDCGLLVRGFEEPPTILMPYNPPSYPAWVEAAGLKKAKDLFAFKVPIPGVPAKEIPQVTRIALKAQERFHVRVRPMNMKRFDEELQRVKEIYNSAWDKNWGFVPMTEEELRFAAEDLKSIVLPELTYFAYLDGKPVGFSLALPDINHALKRANGRLFPFGWIWFLKPFLRKIPTFRILALGVKKSHQHSGIGTLFYQKYFEIAGPRGYKAAELSWILEDNELMNRPIRQMGAKPYKTYRLYEKAL